METAPLKSFATSARTALIREVTARIAVVLAPASPERVEQPSAVAALEKAIPASGGGDAGRAAVADKVAYTWFNRIIALRFMDANGYTGIGVISPERGRGGGQPEVLAEAKRGNIDITVVTNKRTVEAITSLLNGTRRSDDPQGEAYALLLAEYCRHWNRSMPFMFEREGDYTELLIPANLLADDSVLTRAVTVLTEEVCQDAEVIGWLYQFYIEERHDEVFAGFKQRKKAGPAEIPAATQLFTPHWIVRYLVENSLGRLWMLNHPRSRLVDQMDYYIAPVGEETDFRKVNSPEELKVIDPACGSGHMLTYAFDLLYAIYEEEGYAPSVIPGLILANNLHGTEIDPRAGALAAFALMMKARARQRRFFGKKVEPNICVIEPITFAPHELDLLIAPSHDRIAEADFWNQFRYADTFGALVQPDPADVARLGAQVQDKLNVADDLIDLDVYERARRVIVQAKVLSARYDVVIANPPYMGSGNMDARLAGLVADYFANAKQDLYACFVSRGLEFLRPHGLLGIVVGDSWIALKTFGDFRESLLRTVRFHSFLHLDDVSKHADVFGANTAFVCSKSGPSDQQCTFVKLEPLKAEAKRVQFLEAVGSPSRPWVFHRTPTDFRSIPGSPFAYGLTDEDVNAFVHRVGLGRITPFREGINTGDNDRFLRRWWEVSARRASLHDARPTAGSKWVPIKKGGPFRRWAGNQEYVVNWANDGQEIRTFRDEAGRLRSRPQNTDYFFRPSISWGRISSGDFSIRYYPAGYAFDSTGPSGFGSSHDLRFVLGYLNSNLAKRFLSAMSPTLDFRLGNMSNLPAPVDHMGVDVSHVDELIRRAQDDWDQPETSWSFPVDPLVAEGPGRIEDAWDVFCKHSGEQVHRVHELEELNNVRMAHAFGVSYVDQSVELGRIALNVNSVYQYPQLRSPEERERAWLADVVRNLVSYAVGCMFGRYSLGVPGLILADQATTLQDFLAKVPTPTFMPDADNVIPIVDGDWFEDDIVSRSRQFLRAAFGEQHFEENLRFVTESLGVKDLRDYFVKSFYKDHVQRYKKRPVYWLFSSPRGSFNALIYMHRYTPSTASTVLNEYLREYRAKLESSLQHHERLAVASGTPREKAAAQREADRLRNALLELDEYEHDVLYPLATQQVEIDLDDGVKANYPKLGAALKKIPGLEASDE